MKDKKYDNQNSNLGWLFYRGYYNDLQKGDSAQYRDNFATGGKLLNNSQKPYDFEPENNKILGFQLTDTGGGAFSELGNQFLELTTTYPGLLMGSGYTHGTGTQGEFKLGFFFDHTTGLPVLPGSSVKGILRSAFPNWDNDKSTPESKKVAKTNYIWQLLGKDKAENDETKKNFVKKLEKRIFDGTDENGEPLPWNERDIFHDAFIISTDQGEEKEKKNKIMGDDYLTPHTSGPLKNPVPVRFLKILPNVKFKFPFDLKDFDEKVTAADKLNLFFQILSDLGVGAKSNVGYGRVKLIVKITKVDSNYVEFKFGNRMILIPKTQSNIKIGEEWEIQTDRAEKSFRLVRKQS